jgi:hypothetical protein
MAKMSALVAFAALMKFFNGAMQQNSKSKK